MTTKQQVKKHEETLEKILSGSFNTDYILDNIDNLDPFLLCPSDAKIGNAFFTPVEAAFHILPWANADNITILDLCAGIGILSYVHNYGSSEGCKYICIENNPVFVEIGKIIFPQATWICADVTKELIESLEFDMVISNPPFGAKFEGYSEKSELAALRIAMENTYYGGTFIVPRKTGTWRERIENSNSSRDCSSPELTELLKEMNTDKQYITARNIVDIEERFKHANILTEIVDVRIEEVYQNE